MTGECTYTVFGLKKKEQRKNEGDTHKAALPVSNSIDADTAGEGERGKKEDSGKRVQLTFLRFGKGTRSAK